MARPFPPAAAWRRFFASVGYDPATPSRSAPGSPNETFADLIQSFDDAESPGPPDGPAVYLQRHSRATLSKATPVSPISAMDTAAHEAHTHMSDGGARNGWL